MSMHSIPDSAHALVTHGTLSTAEETSGSDVRFIKNIESLQDAHAEVNITWREYPVMGIRKGSLNAVSAIRDILVLSHGTLKL